MKIVTNLAIPYDVYRFYLKVAEHMENCTTEDIIVEALTRYAAMISAEIAQNSKNKAHTDDLWSPLQEN